jgi:tetratricopeptide (TPR) repeat protein
LKVLIMLTNLLDFFFSRPFPEKQPRKRRLIALANAILWGIIAFVVGAFFAGDFALPGENAQALAYFTGAAPASGEAYPLLWMLVKSLGVAPSMMALNLLGAAIMGVVVALTFWVVRFWTLDGMIDDSILAKAPWVSIWTSNTVVLLLVLAFPGLYMGAHFTSSLWGFMCLLLCVMLQNRYIMDGGHRRDMILFAFVLGIATLESPWVLALVPLFFLRTVASEWRLWDHSVRNLPLWFIAYSAGFVLIVIFNTLRCADALTVSAITQVQVAVLHEHLSVLRTFVVGPFIINAGAGVVWPFLAWLTARRLLNNDRAWGLTFTAIVLTLVGFACFYGVNPTPIRFWITAGAIPVATHWLMAVGLGMLLVGWAMQLFARNPNRFEERDRRHIPKHVTASRVVAMFFFPLGIIGVAAILTVQMRRFVAMDREMASRFADEVTASLVADATEPSAGHSYMLGAGWIDRHLMLSAQKREIPLTLFSPDRIGDRAYAAALRNQLAKDPILGDADRLRLVHLLDYNILVFIQDFFVSQPNAAEIATSFSLADVWYAAKCRPMPAGLLYVGVPEEGKASYDPLPAQRALQERWAPVLAEKRLPWWDLSASFQTFVRHHIAFMANNLGAFLDDEGRYAEAAEEYLYASEIHPENISALLNLYDICVRRGQLDDKRVAVNKAFEDFLKKQQKTSNRYDLSAVGRVFGYIRNYELFVQLGWEWAVSAAPESVLAGLRNAQDSLSPTDPRNGIVKAVVAAVYELQGQTTRSFENYQAAIAADPQNIDALRGLARLSIQKGDTNEAGQWLAKAEAAGANMDELDIDRTAYLMAIGDLDGATKAIGRYTSNNKDSAVGWAMLGMLEIEKGNIDRASGFILQNIKRTAEKRDLYFLHVMEGRIAQYEGDKAQRLSVNEKEIPSAIARDDLAKRALKMWDDARKQYRRAYAIRPNVRGLLEQILEFDRRLEDKEGAEADALAILREDTRHPFANFVVGSQRLEDGHVETSLKYFRLAVDGMENPTLDLLNNYADALARTPQTDLAKEMALKAVTKVPENWAVWGTYALALARGGEPEKAKTAIEKSREYLAKDVQAGTIPAIAGLRLGYVDCWIALKQGNKSAASDALTKLKEGLGATCTPLDTRDIQEIEAELAK